VRHRLAGACVALVLAVSAGAAAAQAASGCATANYISGVQAAAIQLHAPGPDAGTVRGQLESLQGNASPPTTALQPVIDALAASPPDIASARTRLDALAGVLALPPGATCHVDSTPARTALHDVYASPVFAGLDATSQPSLLSRIAQFIGDLIGGAARTLGAAGSVALLVAALAAAIAYAAWRLRGQLGARAARSAPEPAGETDDPASEWRAAAAAAGRGDYREAVRRAFRSALLTVALRGGVRVDPSWTTRELLRTIAGDAELLAALAPAADMFDVAWYSGRQVTQQQWEQARQRCEVVRTLARRQRPALR